MTFNEAICRLQEHAAKYPFAGISPDIQVVVAEVERSRREKHDNDDSILLIHRIVLRDRSEHATDSLQKTCELATVIADWASEIRQARIAAEAAGGDKCEQCMFYADCKYFGEPIVGPCFRSREGGER